MVCASCLTINSSSIPKGGSRPNHVLAQSPHHAVRARSEANDVGCAEDETNDQADSCKILLERYHGFGFCSERRTAAHHATHLHCQDVSYCMRMFSHLSGHTLVKGGLATSTTAGNSCNGRHRENMTRSCVWYQLRYESSTDSNAPHSSTLAGCPAAK